jgi:uncharacterized protein (DUF3820 family)
VIRFSAPEPIFASIILRFLSVDNQNLFPFSVQTITIELLKMVQSKTPFGRWLGRITHTSSSYLLFFQDAEEEADGDQDKRMATLLCSRRPLLSQASSSPNWM